MQRDLEEKTEDAFVSYLEANLDGEMNVYAAWDFDEVEYPAVIVFAGASEPISEQSEQNDNRMLSVALAVMTEAAPLTDDKGNTIVSTRQRNINARSDVLDLIDISTLKAKLIARLIPDVAFSMAQMTSTERSVEDRHLITTINLEVIAEPVTGS